MPVLILRVMVAVVWFLGQESFCSVSSSNGWLDSTPNGASKEVYNIVILHYYSILLWGGGEAAETPTTAGEMRLGTIVSGLVRSTGPHGAVSRVPTSRLN